MLKFISASQMCEAQGVIIDVRSEDEFAEAHIPTARSLPLLNNDERAEVGTLYKRQGVEKARLRGIEIVRPKLTGFFPEVDPRILDQAFEQVVTELWGGEQRILDQLTSNQMPAFSQCTDNMHLLNYLVEVESTQNRQNTLSTSKVVTYYCWRGGARSRSMARLAELLGYQTQVIEGGHKAFRQEAMNYLARESYPFRFTILYGLTGSGKTQLLRRWQGEGKPVIDLEALAFHRGSAFGQVGLDRIGGQKDFENNLYWHMRELELRGAKEVFIEGESQRIGRCRLSDAFMKAMERGHRLRVDCPLEQRVQNILAEYVVPAAAQTDATDAADFAASISEDTSLLRLHTEATRALDGIKRRLGGALHQHLTALLAAKDYSAFTRELLVNYYDKQYPLSRAGAEFYHGTITV